MTSDYKTRLSEIIKPGTVSKYRCKTCEYEGTDDCPHKKGITIGPRGCASHSSLRRVGNE